MTGKKLQRLLACLLAAVLIWTEFRFWKKNSMA